MLELEVTENEFLHFLKLGNAIEKEVLWSPADRKSRGQCSEVEKPMKDGRGRLWTKDDSRQLSELVQTLETPDAKTIGGIMGRDPVSIRRKAEELGLELMKQKRVRKPKKK